MSTLPNLLSEIASLLSRGGETRWGLTCGELANRLAAAPRSSWPELSRQGLRWFGGAGSLHDLVLYPGGKLDAALNQEFSARLGELHAALTAALVVPPVRDAVDARRQLHAELEHLRTKVSWAERARQRPDYRQTLRLAHGIPQEYQALCPEYLLSPCPLCGAPLHERIDTRSLAGMGWQRIAPDGFGWMGRYFGGDGRALPQPNHPEPTLHSYRAGCVHAQGVMYGVNLEGVLPDDVPAHQHLFLGAAQPHLHRPFMQLPDSHAVVRTLGVGREDDPGGRPYYTIWLVSYFHPEPGMLWQTLAPQDPLHQFFHWPYADADYELSPWLASGRLHWLDDAGHLSAHGPVLRGWRGHWQRHGGNFYRLPDDARSLQQYFRRQLPWQRICADSAAGLAEFPLCSPRGAQE